ncbi:MAG TPA: hypothetical protein VGP82_09875 [Ktedonobacterales bacterium]|jgi:hypothetical protein|nr:hypothetical protein [Ktedonobacterales bacterium]
MSERTLPLGRLGSLRLSARLSALLGTLLLGAALSAIAVLVVQVPLAEAVLFGLLTVVVHWISDIVHQLGHAWAARRTGYPMAGIRLWWVLSTAVYPQNEPRLPAALHIRRAFGGPTMSLMVTLVAAVLAVLAQPLGGIVWWLAAFLFLDNLLVFTLGSLLPLSFTDGSTLLHWWGKC